MQWEATKLTDLGHVLIGASPDSNGLVSDLAEARRGQWFNNTQHLVAKYSNPFYIMCNLYFVQCILYL